MLVFFDSVAADKGESGKYIRNAAYLVRVISNNRANERINVKVVKKGIKLCEVLVESTLESKVMIESLFHLSFVLT
jgi:hypothetical protein